MALDLRSLFITRCWRVKFETIELYDLGRDLRTRCGGWIEIGYHLCHHVVHLYQGPYKAFKHIRSCNQGLAPLLLIGIGYAGPNGLVRWAHQLLAQCFGVPHVCSRWSRYGIKAINNFASTFEFRVRKFNMSV